MVFLGASLYAWRRRRTNEHPVIIASNHREAALDFEDGPELRGAPADTPKPANPGVQHLPRTELNLTVYLPLGSQARTYELEILSLDGNRVWHAEGQASQIGVAGLTGRLVDQVDVAEPVGVGGVEIAEERLGVNGVAMLKGEGRADDAVGEPAIARRGTSPT